VKALCSTSAGRLCLWWSPLRRNSVLCGGCTLGLWALVGHSVVVVLRLCCGAGGGLLCGGLPSPSIVWEQIISFLLSQQGVCEVSEDTS